MLKALFLDDVSRRVDHYYSSGSQISDIRRDRRAPVTETLNILRVIGTYLYDHALL
jgi:hypothetical protein